MTWEDKVQLCSLSNNGQEQEMIEHFKQHIDDIDPQAMDMFITAVNIDDNIRNKLSDIEDFVMQYESSKLDFRTGLRLEYIKRLLKEKVTSSDRTIVPDFDPDII